VSVFVADEQAGDGAATLPVDGLRWSHLAEAVLAAEGVEGEVEVSILFVDEDHIADLNREFMAHEGPTDVLSFPIDGVTDAGTSGLTPPLAQPTPDLDDQPLLLGDVVICPAVARRQAPDHAGTYDDEIALLLVHGLLHLLGHDHAGDDERVAMQARERTHLADHHGALAADPWAALASMDPALGTTELAATDRATDEAAETAAAESPSPDPTPDPTDP
jgi:probable rRNA maturation factor